MFKLPLLAHVVQVRIVHLSSVTFTRAFAFTLAFVFTFMFTCMAILAFTCCPPPAARRRRDTRATWALVAPCRGVGAQSGGFSSHRRWIWTKFGEIWLQTPVLKTFSGGRNLTKNILKNKFIKLLVLNNETWTIQGAFAVVNYEWSSPFAVIDNKIYTFHNLSHWWPCKKLNPPKNNPSAFFLIIDKINLKTLLFH